jgi:hypothetical protein
MNYGFDPDTQSECVVFIFSAIATADRRIALDIKNVLAEVCDSGYTDRTAIWAELAPPLIVHPFAKKIKDARGWQSSAVASAIDGDLGDALDAGKLTSADVVTIIDEANLPSFSSLDFSCYPTKSHVGEGIKRMKTDRN